MRLSDVTVAIRPRTTWEAMDLGVLMAQQHRRLLMTSWAIVTLPVYALLTLLLWDSPSLVVFLFWWLKPAFERLPLYILSKALFGETPTLKQALRQWPALLRPQLLASLTWRRLSLSRSFLMPVVQLEGLAGEERQQRLRVLLQRNGGAAQWLTILGVHLETVLWFGLMALFYLFVPQQVELEWDWQTLIAVAEHEWLWLEHLLNFLYPLLLIIWEPIYVACGFSLYLNRRTLLEAWDIELVFRRLRQRLSAAAPALALLVLTLLPLAPPTWAAEDDTAPDSARLLNQPLTSEASRERIKAILDAPPFKNQETVTRYRFGEEAPEPAETEEAPGWLKSMFNWSAKRFETIAAIIQALLWAALLGAIAWLAWHYRERLKALANYRPTKRLPMERSAPARMFGLDIREESLPDDVAASAEQLWSSAPREALGLLYRALLSRLHHEFNMALKPADTEGQVLQRVEQLQRESLMTFSRNLTLHWQNIAYGHRPPPAHLQQELCNGWRELFGPGAPR
ncbi:MULTISPECIES: DUF4129 domain-containing protein [Pseudomonas]|uniref:Membrane protein n=1 Tax=Pseudomonas frederiksbergensis TaxID=104087 RepID=A0A0B1Z4K4_9PSED|nr:MULTISPECIES: DUF4129 domain-containing protein [Pseudomonas]KHK64106.1 membrane protein [Pseudomonas frederiksbergensis]MBI6620223.1 DUF4129 domain-containing protein [Pseudomonas corrugata]MBI6691638.1 DUF4129 domain-containing protein [Pseudomonas corrugata]